MIIKIEKLSLVLSFWKWCNHNLMMQVHSSPVRTRVIVQHSSFVLFLCHYTHFVTSIQIGGRPSRCKIHLVSVNFFNDWFSFQFLHKWRNWKKNLPSNNCGRSAPSFVCIVSRWYGEWQTFWISRDKIAHVILT